MTLAEIKALLETTGFPVAYRNFAKPQEMPFICYAIPENNNFAADGVVYYSAKHVQIELYTKLKDEKAEEKVEQALSSFFWEKSEEYIDSEKCYWVIYEIEV